MQKFFQNFIEIWRKEEGLAIFLGSLILLTFIMPPFHRASIMMPLIMDLFITLCLIAGAIALSYSKFLIIANAFIVILAGIFRLLSNMNPTSIMLETIEITTAAICLIIFARLILTKVFEPGPVSNYRIMGAITVYIIIALIWSHLYALVEIIQPNAFSYTNVPSIDINNERILRFTFFSVVTLTTLGYGDIVPVSEAARTLAMLEAFIGQLFPAILIARLVSLQLDSKK